MNMIFILVKQVAMSFPFSRDVAQMVFISDDRLIDARRPDDVAK